MSDPNKLSKYCLRLREADYEYIRTVAETTDSGGVNHIIREIISTHVRHMKSIERKHMDSRNEVTTNPLSN